MRSLLLLAALVLTGCAASRPAEPTQPATLAEVNRSLDGRLALVVFADGRLAEGWYAEIDADSTLLAQVPLRQRPADGPRGVRVATAEIARIEVGTRTTTRGSAPGALQGTALGTLPGLGVAGLGALLDSTCQPNDFDCGLRGSFMVRAGLVSAAVGALTGAVIGASRETTSAPSGWVVYRGPVTRYPDAALALMEAAPLAEPTGASTPPAPEASDPER